MLVDALLVGRGEGGIKGNALTLALEIVVSPLPLVTRGLDGDICIGGVFLRHHDRGGVDPDHHHDQEGDDRPGNLERGALVEVSRLVTFGLAMGIDGIKHHTKDGHTD